MNCKECPWVIMNKHNKMITNFSEKTGRKHNCHMTSEGKHNLWDVKKGSECFGKLQIK